MGVIYLTKNNINGKKYIGVDTKNNKNYYGSGKIIRLALKKYSRTNFTKEILEENDDDKYLFEREQYWIDKYDAINNEDFYNIAEGGKGGAGTLINEESKKLHSEGLEKLILRNKQRKGKTYEEMYGDRADEEKEKRRIAGFGKKYSDERVKKSVDGHKGIVYSMRKTYILTTDNETIILNGRKKLREIIKKINKNIERGYKINVNKLIKNGKEKGCNLKITPLDSI